MRFRTVPLLVLSTAGLVGACGGTGAPAASREEPDVGAAAQAITACADQNPLKNAYFGDLHTHTSYSIDAYAIGNRSDPAAAYAFARGSSVVVAEGASPQGPTTTIDRPLDFLAVTDHSEFYNVDYGCTVDTQSPYYNSAYCQSLRDQGSAAQGVALGDAMAQLLRPDPSLPAVCLGGDPLGGTPAQCASEAAAAWQRHIAATHDAYVPCSFTSLVAYEWTATTGGDNLHRNVIFQDENVPPAPLDYLSYPTAHDLWTGLSQQCTEASGCAAITIPHNSNASGGQMFTVDDADVDYMVKYQTLAEIFQHKGASECLSDPNDAVYDPQCSFELLPGSSGSGDKPGYVRSALERGIAYYASHVGSAKKNPLQLGIVAATDNHNSTPGNVKEGDPATNTGHWPGHLGNTDDTPLLRVQDDGNNQNPDFNPGGITGVWAEQNTRDRIFAALARREVFGTSGPRIKVRFYQYRGTQDPCADANFPRQVVGSGGVPMGGTMNSTVVGTPKFVVYALKDQTDLAEIDIFKASVVNGSVVEQIQRFTVSGGSACVTWPDTGYSAGAPALYYARVLEQPTPRWSHYDCDAVKQSNPSDWQTIAPGCAPGGTLDVNIQERAWTSPIWNLP